MHQGLYLTIPVLYIYLFTRFIEIPHKIGNEIVYYNPWCTYYPLVPKRDILYATDGTSLSTIIGAVFDQQKYVLLFLDEIRLFVDHGLPQYILMQPFNIWCFRVSFEKKQAIFNMIGIENLIDWTTIFVITINRDVKQKMFNFASNFQTNFQSLRFFYYYQKNTETLLSLPK